MSQNTLHCFPVAITAAVALALSGCGGGGSATMPDDMPGMTGGTDTGMTGDGQTLMVPEGLARSMVPAVHDDDEIDLSTQVPALSANLRRDSDNSVAELTTDAYIKSISGDVKNSNLSITYVVDGVEETVAFTSADVADTYANGVDFQMTDGPWASAFYLEYVVRVTTGRGQDRLYATAGFRTDAASMPSGTAEYSGYWRGDSYLSTDPGNRHRIDYRGNVSLMAEFDEDALSGSVNEIQTKSRDASGNNLPWEDLPDTTQFMIHDGQIVDGQFTASLTGMDSTADAPMDMTVSGYEGGVLGEFYGPNAEEIGGAWNATRGDRVVAGNFYARQDDQQ